MKIYKAVYKEYINNGDKFLSLETVSHEGLQMLRTMDQGIVITFYVQALNMDRAWNEAKQKLFVEHKVQL